MMQAAGARKMGGDALMVVKGEEEESKAYHYPVAYVFLRGCGLALNATASEISVGTPAKWDGAATVSLMHGLRCAPEHPRDDA